MKLLSIDPGLTTGIAVYDENGELDLSMTVRKEKILGNGFLNKLVSIAQPEVVLVEDTPPFMPNQEIVALKLELCRWFRVAGFQVEIIKPSEWKKLTKRVEIPGQHARDAATMARWWIEAQK